MRFDCIFFDFDGVIIENSQALAIDAITEVLQSYEVTLDRDYFTQHFLGKRGEDILATLEQTLNVTFPAAALNQIRDLHEYKLATTSKISNSLTPLLNKLPKKYICSSSDIVFINKQLLQHDIKSYFPDEFIFSPLTRSDLKPAPTVYLNGLQHAASNDIACCAIEDSQVGVLAAKTAGLYTIGYVAENNAMQKELLLQAGANEVISDFSELM